MVALYTVKVNYKDALRRFSIPETYSWLELEKSLRKVLNLSEENIQISYTDSDGDIVTISTQEEFLEMINQAQASNSKIIRIKVEVIPGEKISNVIHKQEPPHQEEFVRIESISEEIEAKVSEIEQKSTENEPKPDEPTTSSPTSVESNEHEQANSAPVVEQLSKLFEQFLGIMQQNPEFVENSQRVLTQIFRTVPEISFDIISELGQRSFPIANNNNFSSEREPSMRRGCSRRRKCSPPVHDGLPFAQHAFPSTQNGSPHTHGSVSPQNIHGFNSFGRVGEQFKNIYDQRGKFSHSSKGRWNNENQEINNSILTDEEINKKLDQLHDMGIWFDEESKHLLIQFNGNVKRVIDTFVQQGKI